MSVDGDTWAVGVDSVGEKLLCVGGIAEYVEDAGSGRERVDAEDVLDPRRELVLLEELLERACSGQDPVAVGASVELAGVPDKACGDDEEFAGEFPGGTEGGGTFLGIFDDVDDITEVDDVGWTSLCTRSMNWIPTLSVEPKRLQVSQVIASTTPVVENALTRGEEVIGKRGREGARQRGTCHRRAVTSNGASHQTAGASLRARRAKPVTSVTRGSPTR